MKLALRITTVVLFLVGIIWIIIDPGFDALTAFITGLLTLLTSFMVDSKEESETLDQRNRRILLNHVENFWIKGVLEKSLHGAALLELGMKEEPGAAKYPWGIKKEATDELIPEGTTMLDIFKQVGMGRSLLILGAPGSGKTTVLLELARQLIEHAFQNETEPVPIIFSLASWTENRSFVSWLVQELNIIYNVPEKIAPDWLKGNKLLLLLDGLDETKAEYRSNCVAAINRYRKENGLTSLVVCSRSQDYRKLNTELAFDGVVEIQPLSKEQIEDYLDGFGNQLAGIRKILMRDPQLKEMAETPLFLSVMTIAYRDTASSDIFVSGDVKAQRRQLFEAYTDQMFNHSPRTLTIPFDQQRTLHYLSWLAYKMLNLNVASFFIESLSTKWLEEEATKKKLDAIDRYRLKTMEVFWRKTEFEQPGTIDILQWSWNQARQAIIKNLKMTPPVSIVIILEIILMMRLLHPPKPLINGWIGYISFGCLPFLFSIMAGLASGMISKNVGASKEPGQGIRQSTRNAISYFVLYGLIGLLVFTPTFYFAFANPRIDFYFLFDVFTIPGIVGSLLNGGGKVIQYYSLRTILADNNFLPRQLVPFLDHAANLIFLRRVGGGYIFIHRLLMEYFAEIYTQNEQSH